MNLIILHMIKDTCHLMLLIFGGCNGFYIVYHKQTLVTMAGEDGIARHVVIRASRSELRLAYPIKTSIPRYLILGGRRD